MKIARVHMPLDILNKACFEYLGKFPAPILHDNDLAFLNKSERETYRKIIELLKNHQKNQPAVFDEKINYKAIYQKLHELAESLQLYTNDLPKGELKKFHQAFFIALFENDNKIHTEINQKVIQHNKSNPTSDLQRVTKNQAKLTKRPFTGISHPENNINRFFSGILGIKYHPLKKNNVPYISFEHPNTKRNNLRFGAQINGLGTVNRSFTQYLAVKKAQNPDKPYNHVYINLQKRDMNEGGKFERYFERTRSLALENLENRKSLGIAVVTLPADSRFFFSGFSHATGLSNSNQLTSLNELKDDLVVALQNNTHDFYMSDDVKEALFGNNISPIVGELFARAAKDILGKDYSPQKQVDPTIRQAILFHFVKFHLTDHILNQLQPDNFNISCKDNIDRGGAHNLWYELNLAIRDGTQNIPLEDFQKNLDASALLVKDRPMNNHRNVIWNTLYQQFIHNPQKTAERMPWVGDWLARNIPLEKHLENRLQKPSHEITLSKSLKNSLAKRLGKKPNDLTNSEVLALIQKDVNSRINNIQKAQNQVIGNPVVLTTNSTQKKLDPDVLVTALQNHFVDTKMTVRDHKQSSQGQQFIIEQEANRHQLKPLPPIHVHHFKQENHENYRTTFKFSPENLDNDQFQNAVKALTALALSHAKTNPGKTFTVTAKGNAAYAIAILTELQKHHLVGKLKDNEFNPVEQQAILTEVAKKNPLRARSTSMTNLYAPQNDIPRKTRSNSLGTPLGPEAPKRPKH